MSRAQKILQASTVLLQRLRALGIAIENDDLLAYYARIELWCVQAQIQEGPQS